MRPTRRCFAFDPWPITVFFVVLVTANRDDAGPESLEATIQHQNTPQSLPVFTLANDQRVLRDRQYAETVADRLIEALFDIGSYRGTGRIYLP